MKISILVLTHNAPEYVERTFVTLREVTDPDVLNLCEVVALDNASEEPTRLLLTRLKEEGYIDQLILSEENTFFARGNNIAAESAAPDSDLFLLLNSDVRIDAPGWLGDLVRRKEEGGYAVAAYGCCGKPRRADGYCLLIDRGLYLDYRLDENFPWWGGITKLQHELLADGRRILAVDGHEGVIHHYGGKSGRSYRQAGHDGEKYRIVLEGIEKMKEGIDIVYLDRGGCFSWVKEKNRKIINLLKQL